MPGPSGLDLQSALARSENPLPIVFLTGKGDIPTSVQAMRAGAEDFLTKPVRKEVLFAAIERALARDAQEREQRARRRELRARFDTLTPREREVLAHVLSGQLNKQIAGDLDASERTIKVHRANLMAKLQVQSVAELAHLAHEAGLAEWNEEEWSSGMVEWCGTAPCINITTFQSSTIPTFQPSSLPVFQSSNPPVPVLHQRTIGSLIPSALVSPPKSMNGFDPDEPEQNQSRSRGR